MVQADRPALTRRVLPRVDERVEHPGVVLLQLLDLVVEQLLRAVQDLRPQPEALRARRPDRVGDLLLEGVRERAVLLRLPANERPLVVED